ncbi:hypothetical protein FHS95_001827 [Sphingomonas naasensis]|uniref:DUF2147 domain-containing protein n=1 Tax=Sphingomonas naasensis TaxID=1344951 RepID=A0A4S1WQ99_9SPHN|nr:hypothetical protein [Sphingomonas naasensis]NIJ20135.1 hypothetical protein [Sphingomonas naasensis]TGX44287.1 hypothetical protein E5A74_05660 [Sphingomonas naasensis]
MKARLVVVAAIATVGLGNAAQAQSFFACSANNGQFWGLYRATTASVQLWNPGNGWSGDLCRERDCVITADKIEMQWTSRSEGEYAYTDAQHSFNVNRRSGTASQRYVGDQWTYDGQPYTPNGWNPHSDVLTTGACKKAEDPEAGPPKF